jgi:hypothetical protein
MAVIATSTTIPKDQNRRCDPIAERPNSGFILTIGADCPPGWDCDENVLNKMAHSSNRDKESRGVTQEFAVV